MSFYPELRNTAISLITALGGVCTLSRVTADATTSAKTKCVRVSNDTVTQAGLTVSEGQVGLYILPTAKFAPLPGDIITFGSDIYTVSASTTTKPDGKTTLVHTVVAG